MEKDIMNIEHNGNSYRAVFAVGIESLPKAAEIREEIFIKEQGFTVEFDELDKSAVQCLLCRGEEPVAAARLYPDSEDKECAHIGRVAVVKEMRGLGIGSAVMKAVETYARENGYKRTALSAQCRAEKFYNANGYKARGDVYYDEFCPHVMMYKEL